MKYVVVLDKLAIPSKVHQFDGVNKLGKILRSEIAKDNPDWKASISVLELFGDGDMGEIDEIEILLDASLKTYSVFFFNHKDIAEQFISAGYEEEDVDREEERREWLAEMQFERERGN